jgi:diguanylate cyclase (GGDEF)-like protein/PAS domain S-box-containing protein
LLTGQGDKETDVEATKAGAADYLVKGVLESSLLERAIRYAIAHERTLQTLRESENRFRSVVETANDAIVLMGHGGEIVSWNGSAETIFGYTEAQIVHQPVSALFPATYSQHLLQTNGCDPLIASGVLRLGSRAAELTGIRKDGTEFPLEISLSSWETAEGVFYSGIIRDVTERKSFEDQLTHQALHDPLTKLGNRLLFRDRVEHAIARTVRKRAPIAVLFLDLDNFKSVNDSLGHAAGDELLISVTERLQSCLRSSDTPARFGGDEFAILLEDLEHVSQASFIAERIRTVLCDPFSIAGTEVFIGSSIGIAVSVDGRETPEELLRNADVAMYMSKRNGKDQYTIFENQMHDVLIKRVRLESDMRSALNNREFEVYYQPILDLESEQVMGMEALVRWNHPEHGLIAPLDFIPLAEETGLIIPLGRWILEEACVQTRTWQNRYEYREGLSITVNVASRQFQDDSLEGMIKQALLKSKLPPQSLILEITESTMLSDTESTIEKLQELKKLGIRFAIDDFGTGYSSLSYLQQFPVDILKIDKSFIDKITMTKEGAAVAKAIITMSETLNLKTIAEGIESAGQQSELRQLGCELGQGYHFARPLRMADMNKFLRNSYREQNERRTLIPPTIVNANGKNLALA